MSSELIEELSALYVWPQSVADHHADILTPRQIKKLYEVGEVAERASTTIAALQAELAEAREVPGRIVAWLRGRFQQQRQHPEDQACAQFIATAIEARDWSK